MDRDVSLKKRKVEERELKPTPSAIHYSFTEITAHFLNSIEDVKTQYDVANGLIEEGKEKECKMIWRAQIVFAEGLLDSFIHEMSNFCLFQMFIGNWSKSEKYDNIRLTLGKVEEGLRNNHTDEWFYDFITEKNSREVYLSVESMRDQLNLIGIGFNEVMSYAFPSSSSKKSSEEGTKIIKKLFYRRNLIVHQNDRRIYDLEQLDIDKKMVEEYIENVEKIVNAIIKIANDKMRNDI